VKTPDDLMNLHNKKEFTKINWVVHLSWDNLSYWSEELGLWQKTFNKTMIKMNLLLPAQQK